MPQRVYKEPQRVYKMPQRVYKIPQKVMSQLEKPNVFWKILENSVFY